MGQYIGDFTPGKTIRIAFNTHKADGTPITLAGTPVAKAYKDGSSTTEVTTGVTLTVDFDGLTGSHLLVVDTSADGAFYSAGSDFFVKLTAGTVDSISVVGAELLQFSLANRSALRPTAADRTLDVAATGEAGLDFDNIKQATGATTLTNVTVPTVTTVGTVNALAADSVNASALAASAVTEIQAGLSTLDAAGVRTALGLGSANLDTQLAALPTAAEIFAAVVTTALTESYAADGAAPTLAQALFLIQQRLTEFAISGTTITTKKLDGSTTAATFTLDSATAPTSSTRAS